MTHKTIVQISLVSLLVLALAMPASAGIEAGDILSYSANENGVTAFIANPEGKKNYELDCQVGTRRPEAIESHLITEDPVSVKTLILMDNSLSVRNEYRSKISEILENLVENHAPNEQYTVACFSDTIDCLLKDSSDYEAVKETIRNVTYKDQETYLTDVLYELLTNQEKSEEPVFKRIIIASDGVDNKSIGYTKEELSEVLKENPIPIYTLGCSANNNEEQLKAMLALSRNSKGEGFLLDELDDITDFIRSVKQTDYTIKADITPSKEDMDGTRKGVRITLSTDGGTVQSSFNADMPFVDLAEAAATEAEKKEEVAETTVPETESEKTTEEVSKAAEVTEAEKKTFPALVPILFLVALAVIAGVIIAVILGRKKKKQAAVDEEDINDNPTVLIGEEDEATVLVSDGDEATMLVDKTLVLIDENDRDAEERSAAISKVLVIGRRTDCDIVIPEKTVSRQQFEVGCDGEVVWIRNLSEHGTLLNGERIEGRHEIDTGDHIAAGNAKLRVELRN